MSSHETDTSTPTPSVDQFTFPLRGDQQCPAWCTREHLGSKLCHPEDGLHHESPTIEVSTANKKPVKFSVSCAQWLTTLTAKPERAMVDLVVTAESEYMPLTPAEARQLAAALQTMAAVAESTVPVQQVGYRFVGEIPEEGEGGLRA